MKTGTIVIVILILLIGVIGFFVIKGSSSTGGATGNNPVRGNLNLGGGNQGSGNSNSQGGGGNNTAGTPPTTPVLPTVDKLENHAGQPVYAKYNNTNVYFGTSDKALAKTYNAGEYIGHLGNEAVGNIVCTNHPGYFNIIDTGIQQQTAFGFYIDAPCNVIMNRFQLNQIFGIV